MAGLLTTFIKVVSGSSNLTFYGPGNVPATGYVLDLDASRNFRIKDIVSGVSRILIKPTDGDIDVNFGAAKNFNLVGTDVGLTLGSADAKIQRLASVSQIRHTAPTGWIHTFVGDFAVLNSDLAKTYSSIQFGKSHAEQPDTNGKWGGFIAFITSDIGTGSPVNPIGPHFVMRNTNNLLPVPVIVGEPVTIDCAATKGYVDAAIGGSRTGEWSFQFATTPKTGTVWQNGGTIGNSGSSATNFASSSAFQLFEFLWNNHQQGICPVLGGRGASALQDWGANKTITLPDTRDTFGKFWGGTILDPGRVVGSAQAQSDNAINQVKLTPGPGAGPGPITVPSNGTFSPGIRGGAAFSDSNFSFARSGNPIRPANISMGIACLYL